MFSGLKNCVKTVTIWKKTKMTPYGQAIITSPLPQPPMKVGKLHVGKNGVVSITEIPEEEEIK